jgi:organic hydroperoxide reductase OsmC/OhrA
MARVAEARRYEVRGNSTDTFGRVLLSARNQHFVADGPVQNGCPGEAVGPAELFLSGVAACGVELLQVLARDQDVPLRAVQATIEAVQDPARRTREDVSTFTSVRMAIQLSGVSQAQAEDLVGRFKRR